MWKIASTKRRGKRCGWERVVYTLREILHFKGLVSVLTMKDKGYLKQFFALYFPTQKVHRSTVIFHSYVSFWEAYQRTWVINLEIWTIISPHLWCSFSLSFATSCRPCKPHGTSNWRWGSLLRKNDKCMGKIKVRYILMLVWKMVQRMKQLRAGPKFIMTMLHRNHKKVNLSQDILMQQTVICNSDPPRVNLFQRQDWKSIKMYKSKDFSRLCCHQSQRLIPLWKTIP